MKWVTMRSFLNLGTSNRSPGDSSVVKPPAVYCIDSCNFGRDQLARVLRISFTSASREITSRGFWRWMNLMPVCAGSRHSL